MKVEKLFDAGAFESVEAAVRAAEERTSGEIVPMVVAQSHDYAGVRAVAAALLAFAAGAAMLASPLDPILWLPPVQIAAFGAGYWLAGRRWLLARLIPARRGALAVDRGAALAFLAEGVAETRDRTGILIYVSLIEHRVEVLADRGIYSVVERGTWDGVVESVLGGIREGRAEEGLAAAIGQCADLLAERFPPRPDDEDELENRLRT